mgnify:CR=1 FL=1
MPGVLGRLVTLSLQKLRETLLFYPILTTADPSELIHVLRHTDSGSIQSNGAYSHSNDFSGILPPDFFGHQHELNDSLLELNLRIKVIEASYDLLNLPGIDKIIMSYQGRNSHELSRGRVIWPQKVYLSTTTERSSDPRFYCRT